MPLPRRAPTAPALLAAGLAGVLGCGDDVGAGPDAADGACTPPPSPALVEGVYSDPLALPVPDGCVAGGLVDLPGRWFLRAPSRLFTFSYPRYAGSCSEGFRRDNGRADDADLTDDSYASQVWSDGTRFVSRDLYQFEVPGRGTYEIASVAVVCALPDGTLGGVQITYDTDRGERQYPLIGTRFAPKDTGAQGLSLVGAGPTTAAGDPVVGYNVAVDGTHAFVVGPLGFDAFDVSTPTAPVHVAHIAGAFNDVKLARSGADLIAYAAPIDNEAITIIDVSTPANATAIGQIGEYAHSVFATASPPRLYLANYTASVPVYDLGSPRNPTRIGAIPTGGATDVGIHDLFVDGTRLYANKTTEGVVAVDFTAGLGAAAVRLGGLVTSYSHASWAGTAGGRPILIHGDEGLAPEGGAFLRVLDADASSPTFMQELSRFATRPEVGIHNMVLVGDRAYIAYYQDGVRVVDLADPTQPREIGFYNTWDEATAPGGGFEGAVGITVVGDLIYVADFSKGLLILRDDTN